MSRPPALNALGHDPFEIRRRSDAHGVVLALEGELDLATAPELEQELREVEAIGPRRILIDLRRLRFMDCTGIAVMARAQASARSNGHRLAVRRGPDQVHRVFELSGLLRCFTFEEERRCSP